MSDLSPRLLLQRYSLALITVVIATLATAILEAYETPRFIFFVGAVVVSAWYGGLLPGLFATFTSLIIIEVRFLAPTRDFAFDFEQLLMYLTFVFVGIVVSWLEETRKRSEEALRKSEALFRATQDYSLNGFTVLESVRDEEGKIVDFRWLYVNRAAGEILKNDHKRLIGQQLLHHYPKSELFKNFVKVVETGQPDSLEVYYEDDAIRGWFRNMAVKLDDGVAVSFNDITKRKEDEQRAIILQETTAALSQALTLEEVLNVVIDRACLALNAHHGLVGIIDGESLELLKFTGESKESFERNRIIPLNKSAAMTEAIRAGKLVWAETQEDYVRRFPDYASIAIESIGLQAMVAMPLKVNEKIIGSIMLSFPHPQKISEDDRRFLITLADNCAQAIERARLYEAEHRARHQAEEANRLKLQFLGMISHELRTPLTSIKGFATTLLAEDVTFDEETQKKFISIISEESDKLTDLIDQLLNLTRMQAGTLPILLMPQPFEAVLATAHAQLHALTVNHQLVIDIPPDLPVLLLDSVRIAQVLVNLVGNATKFSPAGSQVTISVKQHHDEVEVRVSDQGMGIPHEAREYIFEAFRQVQRKLPHETKGAGLGLAICKGLVSAHGGKIRVCNHEGAGTTIAFTLKVANNGQLSAIGNQPLAFHG